MIKAQKSWVKHKDTPKYKVRDQVWLEGCHLRTNQPTMKLAPRRHGPFRIVQVMSSVNYCLKLPTQWSIHPVFHIVAVILRAMTKQGKVDELSRRVTISAGRR